MKSTSRSLACKLFPRETWHKHSDGVYVASSRHPLDKELQMAEILARYGHTVYLLPEIGKGKHADAIVDGRLFEFKAVTGNRNTLGTNFAKALKQASNVFISTNGFTRKEVYTKLVGTTKVLLHSNTIIDENGIVYVAIDGVLVSYKLKTLITQATK